MGVWVCGGWGGRGGEGGGNLQDCCSASNNPAFDSEDGSFTRQPKAGNVQASSDQTTRIVTQVKDEGVTPSFLQVDTPSMPEVMPSSRMHCFQHDWLPASKAPMLTCYMSASRQKTHVTLCTMPWEAYYLLENVLQQPHAGTRACG